MLIAEATQISIQFFVALQEEWSKLPLERLQKLVDSIPQRCAAVINAQDYAMKY